jgi:hypothetical protein
VQKNPFQKRILISEHQTVIGITTPFSFDTPQPFAVSIDFCFEFFDIFGATFTERCLGVSVALTTSFGCELLKIHQLEDQWQKWDALTALRPPLFLGAS